MLASLWSLCLKQLQGELSAQEFNTWIRPLQVMEDGNGLSVLAPNRFVLDWVRKHFLPRILEILARLNRGRAPALQLRVGSRGNEARPGSDPARENVRQLVAATDSPLNPRFTFNTFVPGRSNQLARVASMQAAENHDFNPLFIYGGVGLGKTHLMQAVGHLMRQRQPGAKIVYLHSERFVANMVRALQNKTIDNFKQHYRSASMLLVDDIQFLVGKSQSQEEFFHTFNTLVEDHHQVVLTCDRVPRELGGLEEKLRSRLGSGLTVEVQPPELETRVAILQAKALDAQSPLPEEVAVYIAENMHSSIRELEGALHRLLASARYLDEPLSLDLCKEALRDLLAHSEPRLVTIQAIQQAVAEYYQLSVGELNSKNRRRHIVRPRQLAMTLAKELTPHSLPEIGNAFSRDRTTVLHSCKTIANLLDSDHKLKQDYQSLQKKLSS